MFQTEFEFTLPCGYLDESGELHRDGLMRRATAGDEIRPLGDPRVVKNPATLVFVLLARVVVRLGGVETITPQTIENLFAVDVRFLQDLYNTINDPSAAQAEVVCPHCRGAFVPEPAPAGGSHATPSTSSWAR